MYFAFHHSFLLWFTFQNHLHMHGNQIPWRMIVVTDWKFQTLLTFVLFNIVVVLLLSSLYAYTIGIWALLHLNIFFISRAFSGEIESPEEWRMKGKYQPWNVPRKYNYVCTRPSFLITCGFLRKVVARNGCRCEIVKGRHHYNLWAALWDFQEITWGTSISQSLLLLYIDMCGPRNHQQQLCKPYRVAGGHLFSD